MRPIHFEEANVTYGKPAGMTDEECMPISAFQLKNEQGQVVQINTLWQPNKEDIEAINAGRGIVLAVCGSVLSPVSLFTFDENGHSNE